MAVLLHHRIKYARIQVLFNLRVHIFVFLQPMWRQERTGFPEHPSLRGLNPYYKRFDWKTWLSDFLKLYHLSFEMHVGKARRNGPTLNYVHSPVVYQKSLTDLFKECHWKLSEKNELLNTTWTKSHGFIDQKHQNSFE